MLQKTKISASILTKTDRSCLYSNRTIIYWTYIPGRGKQKKCGYQEYFKALVTVVKTIGVKYME